MCESQHFVAEIEIIWYKRFSFILVSIKIINRKQRPELHCHSVNKYLLGWEIVKHGVPQGSELGPLFLIIQGVTGGTDQTSGECSLC